MHALITALSQKGQCAFGQVLSPKLYSKSYLTKPSVLNHQGALGRVDNTPAEAEAAGVMTLSLHLWLLRPVPTDGSQTLQYLCKACAYCWSCKPYPA